ncbi:hypothetical protein L6164_011183 [Bauhinia variegata]|uniref:Uncharacterized protein n=1 Tax=Bauhinia variegata TaxID=167791 RepID=A0ACB9P6C8_BAUVA|nr:hypothetical protein L6164_011183 [Bauhinia variegata]
MFCHVKRRNQNFGTLNRLSMTSKLKLLTWTQSGAPKEHATKNRHLKRKSTKATRTCGQESNSKADVAPTSDLNGSKSNTTYLHCQLRSKPQTERAKRTKT